VWSERAAVDRTERVVVDGVHGLSRARRVTRDVAGEALGDDRAADVALATSELVTNALEHGSGGPVEIVVTAAGGAVEISITSSSGAVPVPPAQRRAPASQVRGRGLQIVAAVADHVVISGEDGQVSVTCRFEHPIG
jgi:anti-sigma regulatory factor (Ser/Thr protein kinase)